MAKDLIFEESTLSYVSSQLSQVSTKLNQAASLLQRISFSEVNGGAVKHSTSIRLRTTGGSVSGSSVATSASACSRGIQSLSAYSGKLGKDVRTVMENFRTTENDLAKLHVEDRDIDKLPDGIAIAGMTDTIGDILKRTVTKFTDFIDRFNERREARKQYLDEANQQRVYDEDGLYGSQQHGPLLAQDRYKEFRDIIEKNTGKHFNTGAEVQAYLLKLNSEGCGYAAMANVIMHAYEGRAAEFERTFGYPMYVDGDLNYNALLVDLYSSTDNYHLKNGKYVHDKYEDYDGFFEEGLWFLYNEYSDTSGSGTDAETRGDRMMKFLNEHDVDVKVKQNVKVTPENFEELSKKGDIIVRVGDPYYLYDSNNQKSKSDKGHAMTIVGVEDGRYVVSSWGETYYLDPNDKHGYIEYSQFIIG